MTEPRRHGPLPVLLLGLTVVTGLVDAFSYLRLGHVFVANMTGNVVFFGFALAGAGDVSLAATSLALAAFAVGAALGGRWLVGRSPHRGHLLAAVTAVQAGLVMAAATVSGLATVADAPVRLTLIVLLALAMGGQNAVVRRLAVPDLTTTVLTRTLTGLLGDAAPWPVRLWRIAGVLALLIGAAIGGVLLRWVALPAPLWLAGLMLSGCAVAAFVAARRPTSAAWR